MSLPCEALLASGVDPLWVTSDAEAEATLTGTYTTPAGQVREYGADLQACMDACASCPLLLQCRDRARSVDVAGYCGGLRESQRSGARPAYLPVSLTDPAALPLIVEALEDAPAAFAGGTSRIPALLRQVCVAWAAEGVTLPEMLVRLAGAVLSDGGPITRSTLHEVFRSSATRASAWEQEVLPL